MWLSKLKYGDAVWARWSRDFFETRYVDRLEDDWWTVEARDARGLPVYMCGYKANTFAKQIFKIIIFNKTLMSKITALLTRLIDKDIRTLLKANYLTDKLDLTDEGVKALLVILLEEKKAELVKLAQESIENGYEK